MEKPSGARFFIEPLIILLEEPHKNPLHGGFGLFKLRFSGFQVLFSHVQCYRESILLNNDTYSVIDPISDLKKKQQLLK